MPTRFIIGCMTGTSIDGIDAAMIAVEGHALAARPRFVRGLSRPLGDLGPRLKAIADQCPTNAREITAVAREFSLLHADVVAELRSAEPCAPAECLAVHGQTVFHAPPLSWQLFNPAPLVEHAGLPVVFDLRAADLARGGQGAPITPLADWLFFGDANERRAVVNLGGFCNITLLPAAARADPTATSLIRGFDVCACNHLLNAVARLTLNAPFDRDGAAARSGRVHLAGLSDLSAVLESQSAARRSLGTGDEITECVDRHRTQMTGADLAATACEAIGQTIARRVFAQAGSVHRFLLAGGGARNLALATAIARAAAERGGAQVGTTTDHALPIEFREAAEIALLGALCADGTPITLSAVTGAREPASISGVWAGGHPLLRAAR